jgi:hypothetical protein
MKKLAARNFEDILQVMSDSTAYSHCASANLLRPKCSIPVFEGLLPPPHNNVVLDLLFELALWHAFAKLRIHTDDSLDLFQVSTRSLTAATRRFLKVTCTAYRTQELPKETAARGRRTAALANKGHGKPKPHAPRGKSARGSQPEPKGKTLNLATYKYHALADYPDTIR